MGWKRELAFISDVHSNLEALEAVLKDIGGKVTYCLGDSVGYGASPNEVIALLRKEGVACILGNHDYAVLSGRLNEFNSTRDAGGHLDHQGSERAESGVPGVPPAEPHDPL